MKLHSAAAVLALALSTLAVTLVHATTVDDTTVSDTTVDANDVMPSVLDVAADLWTSMARAVSSAFSSTEKVTTLLPLESFQPHIVRLATSNWTVLNGWAMEDAGDGAHAAAATTTALLVHAPWCAHSRAALAQWRNLSRVVQQRSLAVRLCDVDAVADPELVALFRVAGYPSIRIVANRTVHSYHDALDVEALAAYLKDRRWNKTIASTASSPSTVPAGTAANVAVLRAFVPNLTFQLPLVENGWSQFQVLQIKAYHIVVQLGLEYQAYARQAIVQSYRWVMITFPDFKIWLHGFGHSHATDAPEKKCPHSGAVLGAETLPADHPPIDGATEADKARCPFHDTSASSE